MRTADIYSGHAARWQQVVPVARKIFAQTQTREIRTPILANVAVFSRSAGELRAIEPMQKPTFVHMRDRKLALRPVRTAGVVRAYVANKLTGPATACPTCVTTMGPMFR